MLLIIPFIIIGFIIFNNLQIINIDIYEKFENNNNINTSNIINTSNYNDISPVIKIAEQVDKLKVLENINSKIEVKNEDLMNEINSKGNQLNILNDIMNKRNNEKIELEDEISKLNKQKEIHNSIAKTLIKGIKNIDNREEELKKREIEIKKEIRELQELKNKPIPEIPPVKINQEQLDILLEKLIIIEKLFKEVKEKQEEETKKKKDIDICNLYSSMPTPSKNDFLNNNKKDLSYLWCLCNDNINKNIDCMEYKNCLKNYEENKNKDTLKEEDLKLYFRCVNKFTDFPKFLIENNEKK